MHHLTEWVYPLTPESFSHATSSSRTATKELPRQREDSFVISERRYSVPPFYLAEFLASGTKWGRNNFFALSSSQKILSASSLWRYSIFFPFAIKQRFHRHTEGCCYPAESGEFSFRDSPPPRDLSIVLAESDSIVILFIKLIG